MKNIMKFYEEKKTELKIYFQKRKLENKFSVTVDEWSDINVRRYMNITIHSTAIFCVLGLVIVEGSCDSDITIKLVKNRLAEFGIDMNSDVVASTHDGASVMVKYGRKFQAFSQLC